MHIEASSTTPTTERRRRTHGRRASDALPKVPCPDCGCSTSVVVSTRPVFTRNGIRRRRQCDECGGRFTTMELIVEASHVAPPARLTTFDARVTSIVRRELEDAQIAAAIIRGPIIRP